MRGHASHDVNGEGGLAHPSPCPRKAVGMAPGQFGNTGPLAFPTLAIRVHAGFVLVLLGVQLLLGIGSFLARFSSFWIPGEQLTVIALPVAHRFVGSLILAATVILAVRVSVEARPTAHQ